MRKNISNGNPIVLKQYPSNGILNAKLGEEIETEIDGVKVFKSVPTSVDELPEGYDFYIVSAIYASSAKSVGVDSSKLLITKNPVIASETDATVIGCTAFGRIF